MALDHQAMLQVALEEARLGLAEGGIPIGAALFSGDGVLLGRGHNRRVQDSDPSVHGETDAFRKAGRQRSYRHTVMVTTLAPCWYCSGLVRQFRIGTVLVGESRNFGGGLDWLRESGVKVIDLDSPECVQLLAGFIQAHPELWNEDIGELSESPQHAEHAAGQRTPEDMLHILAPAQRETRSTAARQSATTVAADIIQERRPEPAHAAPSGAADIIQQGRTDAQPAIKPAQIEQRTMAKQGTPIEPADIEHTARLITPHLRRTPALTVPGAELGLAGGRLTFKLEMLQHAGSFKTRGAFANLLSREIPAAGVVAASGGNHGVAVAYAASRLSIPAKIFVPRISSPAKIERIRALGAQLIVSGERYSDALAVSAAWVQRTGALAIHAFDQRETLLGQGTVAWELEQQVPDLDTVLVAVGGGGLIGGIAAWYAGRVRIIGVEPEAAPTLTRALGAGEPVDAEGGGIAADALAPRRVGSLMFGIAQRHVEQVLLVPDAAMRAAQQALWDGLRVVTEPAGAAAFAALLTGGYQPRPEERVGVILSGANTDAVSFKLAT